jgi:hypothetical protein
MYGQKLELKVWHLIPSRKIFVKNMCALNYENKYGITSEPLKYWISWLKATNIAASWMYYFTHFYKKFVITFLFLKCANMTYITYYQKTSTFTYHVPVKGKCVKYTVFLTKSAAYPDAIYHFVQPSLVSSPQKKVPRVQLLMMMLGSSYSMRNL